MCQGESSWYGGEESGLRRDQGQLNAVSHLASHGASGGECIEGAAHSEDRTQQTQEWRGDYKGAQACENPLHLRQGSFGLPTCSGVRFQCAEMEKALNIAKPDGEREDGDGEHEGAAAFQIIQNLFQNAQGFSPLRAFSLACNKHKDTSSSSA